MAKDRDKDFFLSLSFPDLRQKHAQAAGFNTAQEKSVHSVPSGSEFQLRLGHDIGQEPSDLSFFICDMKIINSGDVRASLR